VNEKEERDVPAAPDMQKALGQLIPGVYVIGVLVASFYLVFFWRNGLSNDPSDWGTLGDYFGGLMNPVVSFGTLIVAYAVWKQQREELRLTKEALEDQAKTAEQHRQEQRFFDLLSVYNRTLDSYTASIDHGRDVTGKEAVSGALRALPAYLSLTIRYGFGQTTQGQTLTPVTVQQIWFQKRELKAFTTYLRVVYRLLEEAEPLLGDQHDRYVKLFQSQLSEDELLLIGLLSWLDSRWHAEHALLRKYGLLEHFPEGPLRRELSDLLSKGVFNMEVSPC
jgi:hypothetical protein